MPSRRRSVLVSAKRLERPVGDVIHRPGRVDTYQDASCCVKRDERCGLFRIDLEAMADGLGHVVVALEEVAPAAVAEPLTGRWVEVDVPDRPAAMAGAAPGEPAHDLVVVDHQLEHDVELVAEVGQQLLQGLGLRNGAGKAVEQEPARRRPPRRADCAPSPPSPNRGPGHRRPYIAWPTCRDRFPH